MSLNLLEIFSGYLSNFEVFLTKEKKGQVYLRKLVAGANVCLEFKFESNRGVLRILVFMQNKKVLLSQISRT